MIAKKNILLLHCISCLISMQKRTYNINKIPCGIPNSCTNFSFAQMYFIGTANSNNMYEMPSRYGIGNMEISVMGVNPTEEEHLVISHHNIFNNTKIKLKTYPNNSELEQCTICLANIENNQIVREINKCKHCFHVECADKWFEEHITCPHCRQDIRIEMVD